MLQSFEFDDPNIPQADFDPTPGIIAFTDALKSVVTCIMDSDDSLTCDVDPVEV